MASTAVKCDTAGGKACAGAGARRGGPDSYRPNAHLHVVVGVTRLHEAVPTQQLCVRELPVVVHLGAGSSRVNGGKCCRVSTKRTAGVLSELATLTCPRCHLPAPPLLRCPWWRSSAAHACTSSSRTAVGRGNKRHSTSCLCIHHDRYRTKKPNPVETNTVQGMHVRKRHTRSVARASLSRTASSSHPSPLNRPR